MYSAAPKFDSAFSSRKTVNERFGASPVAFTWKLSKPMSSVVSLTVMSTSACGMQAASWAEEAVRSSFWEGTAAAVRAWLEAWLLLAATALPARAAVPASAAARIDRYCKLM